MLPHPMVIPARGGHPADQLGSQIQVDLDVRTAGSAPGARALEPVLARRGRLRRARTATGRASPRTAPGGSGWRPSFSPSGSSSEAAAAARLAFGRSVARLDNSLSIRVSCLAGPSTQPRQWLLFAGAYYLYRIVRGLVDGQRDTSPSSTRARSSTFERSAAHSSSSPDVQHWAIEQHGVHRRRELDVRQLALPGHDDVPDLALHRAQPRLLLRAQHVHGRDGARARRLRRCSRPPRRASCPSGASPDTVADFFGDGASQTAGVLYNPYAAIPSMHVAFALMIARARRRSSSRTAPAQDRLVALPAARHLRGHRDRATTSGSTPRSARSSPERRPASPRAVGSGRGPAGGAGPGATASARGEPRRLRASAQRTARRVPRPRAQPR